MIKPLGVHVLIKPIKEESSIIIPGSAEVQAEKGEVLGVGEGVEVQVKKGVIVIFKKYSPEEFEMNGETVYLIEEEDLMGVYEGE